ncbi:neuropeptide CCHamide-2 isoform X2 [Cryptotermes secundus]|uniref:neuropeptide CCHamide-2 isoform X2 n=1 Tax=Cryptotermes secundus TaxID=105785 RepID=UPI000CD7AB0F|nr:neuropeptide CCHamide-2 isoform X2 [Cryptotermes secundus]
MALQRCPSLLIVLTAIIVLMVEIDQSSAKRGCSSFGHSCFGGHGKRADEGVLLLPGADSDQQQRLMFPARETGSEDGEDTMIQPEGYGALSPASSASLVPSANRLSPFLRQWLQSYRRSTGDIEVE